MYAVMVCMDSVTCSVKFLVLPLAIVTIIVSPIARDIPSTNEAMIPDKAAGTMTRMVVSNLVAPKADDPSRIAWGTEFIASSDMEAIIGIIMTPITIPGLRMFVGSDRKSTRLNSSHVAISYA